MKTSLLQNKICNKQTHWRTLNRDYTSLNCTEAMIVTRFETIRISLRCFTATERLNVRDCLRH